MSDPTILIGQKIDHYQVNSLIGQGGMAAVYLARDVTLEREVVLKTMLPTLAQNQELMSRFQREAKATAQLQHPNIVPVYTTGVTPTKQPYIALQYIKGGALNDYLRQLAGQGQWISTIYALSIARQIGDALRVAHAANIIHRDLKPANILLRTDGTPVLSDLGIAAVQQATTRLTQTGSIIGTPTYMSPEQATGKPIDGRSDIYSLGVILYELLSGQLPFDADSPWAIIHQHIYEPPPPLEQVRPDLTPQTHRIVAQCLQKEPDSRYQTAVQLVAALDDAMSAEGGNSKVALDSWRPPAAARVVKGPPTTRRSIRRVAQQPPPLPPVPPTDVVPPPTQPPAAAPARKVPVWGIAALVVLTAVIAYIFIARPFSSAPATPAPPPSAPAEPVVAVVTQVVIATPTPGTEPAEPTSLPVVNTVPASAVPPLVPTLVPSSVPTIAPLPTAANPFPDGLIAYSCGTAGNNQIYLNVPNGGVQFRLANQPGNSIVPAFSPDGRQIAFRSNISGAWQIYVSDVDGGNLRQVTAGSANNNEAVWSPDGSQFAFVSDRDGSRQIYLMNSDGSNQRRLTTNDDFNDDPSWSVNGQIIYESNENGRYSIFQISPQGGSLIELIAWGDSSSTPAWSHDGQWLAFESRVGDNRHIWIARSDGSGVQQVTSRSSNNERPAWSPDGTKIAFHTNYMQSDSDHADVWVIDLATKAVQRVSYEGNCYNPSWALVPAEMVAENTP